jgi:hypothetical protein
MSPTTSQSKCMRLQTDDVRLLEVKAGGRPASAVCGFQGPKTNTVRERITFDVVIISGNSIISRHDLNEICTILNLYRIEMPTQGFGGMRATNSARNTTVSQTVKHRSYIYIRDLPYSSFMQGKLDNATYILYLVWGSSPPNESRRAGPRDRLDPAGEALILRPSVTRPTFCLFCND